MAMSRGGAASGGPPGGGSMRAQAERAEKTEMAEKTASRPAAKANPRPASVDDVLKLLIEAW